MTSDRTDDTAARRLAERFATIWNAHDMQRLAEIYAPDADFVNVIGMRWKGAGQIAQAHVLLHESRMRQTKLASEGLTVRFLAPTEPTITSSIGIEETITPSMKPLCNTLSTVRRS